MAIIGFIVIFVIGVLALGAGLLSLSFCTKIGAGRSDIGLSWALVAAGGSLTWCALANSPLTITLVTQ